MPSCQYGAISSLGANVIPRSVIQPLSKGEYLQSLGFLYAGRRLRAPLRCCAVGRRAIKVGNAGSHSMQKPFIISRGSDDMAAPEEDQESGSGTLTASGEMLARHGASVLGSAAHPVDGWPAPRSTVYRSQTLLLPPDLHEDEALRALNEVLRPAEMRLVTVAPPDATTGGGPVTDLPYPAVLVPDAEEGVVDAWHALGLLRQATSPGGALARADVNRIGLEHLLVGAAVTGEPIVYSGSVPGGEPIVYSGSTPGGEPIVYSGSYLYGGASGRAPVEIAMDAPARNSEQACTGKYGRRPVIAVLDTGVRAHPWLDVAEGKDYPEADRRDAFETTAGGFVQVDQDIQDAIHARGHQVRTSGDCERQVIRYPWDASAPTDMLVKGLDSHIGHGTFIAGIVRQIVPDATLLSIRLMHSDGIVYEGDLIWALRLIAERVETAYRDNNPALMVDVVSLSLGYFAESPADVAYTSGLRQVIDRLRCLGVVVTAA